ncbi:peroxide stress protein YaaA [Arsukibacterium sp.]|uniref:peroxide stress protein YaaA n=1 Tax=Arsukibacterium sp. TaxID=1977258 RepID=UPI00299F1E77|nr:peroxide stress protein YaaA [Arsukibacterium sp.]MDX1678512.1 peroxide stress protein YaaA [Arsukibacterium sp.]
MLMVVSPAKDLDANPISLQLATTMPALLAEANELANICKKLSPAELGSLMHISDKLAGLNAARFSQWHQDYAADEGKAALFMFNGDVYQGLDAASLSTTQLQYAQNHLRILSGLYGVLRPLDLMLPYRLEMGTRLANAAGGDLYAFWQEQITDNLNTQLAELHTDVLLNLASQEYFKAVKTKSLRARVITPVFKDFKNGQYKIISFFAKKARGLMARYIIEQQITDPKAITDFNLAGYHYSKDDSTADKPVFLRRQAE